MGHVVPGNQDRGGIALVKYGCQCRLLSWVAGSNNKLLVLTTSAQMRVLVQTTFLKICVLPFGNPERLAACVHGMLSFAVAGLQDQVPTATHHLVVTGL